MANYNIGGVKTFGDYTMGWYDNAGGGKFMSLGDTFSFNPEGDTMGRLNEYYRENNAYVDDTHAEPENILLLTSQTIGNKTLYIGSYGLVVNNIMYPQVVMSESEDFSEPTTVYSESYSDLVGIDKNFLWFYRTTNGSPNPDHIFLCYGATWEGTPLSPDSVKDLIARGGNPTPSNPITLQWPSGGNIDPEDIENSPEESEPGGGTGDWDNDSDVIPWPDLPTLGAANCGFLTVYNPSAANMRDLGFYLWSDFDNVFQNISKYQTNMLDLIVSLSVVPVAPIVSEAVPLKIGGKDVGIYCEPVASQYMAFDCGTFDVSEYYGSSLDYGPYTKVQIYLPAVGYRELKTDEVMDGSVSVRYNIDLVTGACVAMVRCQRHGLDAVLYQFEGNIAMQIPLTGRDFMPMYSSLAKAPLGVLGGAASGGAVGAAGGLADAAINVMTMKPNIQRAGSLSSNSGHLGIRKPYLIIERPIQSYPKDANAFYGYPCNQTMKLSTCHGYTEAEADILDISCTADELDEIRKLLSEGILL